MVDVSIHIELGFMNSESQVEDRIEDCLKDKIELQDLINLCDYYTIEHIVIHEDQSYLRITRRPQLWKLCESIDFHFAL